MPYKKHFAGHFDVKKLTTLKGDAWENTDIT